MGSPDTATVDKPEPEKYMETWYEITRSPNSFEKGLAE